MNCVVCCNEIPPSHDDSRHIFTGLYAGSAGNPARTALVLVFHRHDAHVVQHLDTRPDGVADEAQ